FRSSRGPDNDSGLRVVGTSDRSVEPVHLRVARSIRTHPLLKSCARLLHNINQHLTSKIQHPICYCNSMELTSTVSPSSVPLTLAFKSFSLRAASSVAC